MGFAAHSEAGFEVDNFGDPSELGEANRIKVPTGLDDGLDGVVIEGGVVAIAYLNILALADVDVVFAVELLDGFGAAAEVLT